MTFSRGNRFRRLYFVDKLVTPLLEKPAMVKLELIQVLNEADADSKNY